MLLSSNSQNVFPISVNQRQSPPSVVITPFNTSSDSSFCVLSRHGGAPHLHGGAHHRHGGTPHLHGGARHFHGGASG